jgi:DNA polymerase-3 subunit delta'
VLLTSRPSRLLDTIRSRTLPVRFAPLPERVIRSILEQRGIDPSVAALAEGSASLAIELADPEAKAERDAFVSAALQALDSRDLVAAVKLSEGPTRDRDTLRAELSFLAQALSEEARRVVKDDPALAERRALAHENVLLAIADVERNVQPALALEAMAVRSGLH